MVERAQGRRFPLQLAGFIWRRIPANERAVSVDPIQRAEPPKSTDTPPPAKPELLKPTGKDPIRVAAPGTGISVPDGSGDYQILDESLRNKLQQKDQGDKAGAKEGTTDANLARSLRWVMKFNVGSGKEYVAQLAVLKAVILVPVPPANKEMMLFDNLNDPKPGKIAADKDIDQLSKLIRFSDTSKEAVKEIAAALGVTANKPQAFYAFFPKEIEDELAKKEHDYKGLKSEDIKETTFRVTIREKSYEIQVIDQKTKK